MTDIYWVCPQTKVRSWPGANVPKAFPICT